MPALITSDITETLEQRYSDHADNQNILADATKKKQKKKPFVRVVSSARTRETCVEHVTVTTLQWRRGQP